MLFVRVMQM